MVTMRGLNIQESDFKKKLLFHLFYFVKDHR